MPLQAVTGIQGKVKKMSAYLTLTQRHTIEVMLKDGKKPKEIAEVVGKHFTTIYREKKKGTIELLNSNLTTRHEYCCDVGHRIMKERSQNKGLEKKLTKETELLEHIAFLIKEKRYSPYAVLQDIKKRDDCPVSMCETTLYKYIHEGLIPGVSDKDLYIKSNKKQKKKKASTEKVRMKRGKSIEERPDEVDDRSDYGHWEMDTVYSGQCVKSKSALLVLTERKTLDEYFFLMPDRTLSSTVSVLDELEKSIGYETFRNKFKTITVDNGVEFGDSSLLERSCYDDTKKRTEVFFCHPYSSYERGQNENQNRFVRYWVEKGGALDRYTADEWILIAEWLNNYPRKKFGGMSTNEYKKTLGIA